MSSSDSKYGSLNDNLSAAGKEAFVNFYYDFKNTEITQKELSEKLFNENPRSRSMRQGFRIPRARHIFETGQEIDALKLIIESSRIDEGVKQKARKILADELKSSSARLDIEEEQTVAEKINKEIIYSDKDDFEYDNSPKPPKQHDSGRTSRYKRDPEVAKHALAKANFMCEVSSSHVLFKRKNSDINYTEPHHLIPMAASKDFPTIDLDREQNVVSLCSHCHNLLHYGADSDDILKILFDLRKDLLKAIGAEINFEQLKKYY